MGTALANYENFKKRGFDIQAIFDVDNSKVGQRVNDIEIIHMDDLDKYVIEHPVDIAMLTVPNRRINDAVTRITEVGIKGIWNFSPTDIRLGGDVVVENVHLSDSLMVLGYRLREKGF